MLEISYDGSQFSGSQYQPDKFTVESNLKEHLSYFFKDIENLIFAGRTDSGVHANSQVVNFKSTFNIALSNIKFHINKHSKSIKINKIRQENQCFHSRKSAIKRQYIYIVSDLDLPVYLSDYVSYVNVILDNNLIQECLNVLIGEHDFCVFQKKGSPVSSTIRKVYDAKIEDFQYKLLTDSHKSIILKKITIEGNAFLYRMIRHIMGAIFIILSNKNELTILDFKNLLIQKKRIFNFKPAPSAGLYLNKIWY